MTNGQQIKIDGIQYVIEGARPYLYNGKQRTALFIRRPAGRKTYTAYVYENGQVSKVV